MSISAWILVGTVVVAYLWYLLSAMRTRRLSGSPPPLVARTRIDDIPITDVGYGSAGHDSHHHSIDGTPHHPDASHGTGH